MERRGIVAAVLREERILRGDDCEVARRADDDADLERERVLDRGSDARRRSALRLSGAKEDVATLQDRGDVARPRAVSALLNSDIGSRFLPATLTARSSAT